MGLLPGLGGDKRANGNLSTSQRGKGGTLSFKRATQAYLINGTTTITTIHK